MSFAFRLLLLVLESVAQHLNCSNSPIRLSAGDNFVIDIHDTDFDPNCVFVFIPDLYIVPSFSFDAQIDDPVTITSDPTPFTNIPVFSIGAYINGFQISQKENETLWEDPYHIDLDWVPVPFNVTFALDPRFLNSEVFIMKINGKDCRPKQTTRMMVNGDGFTTFVDSENFSGDHSSAQLIAINSTIQLRVVNYPEIPWDDVSENSIYIYEGEQYLCSVFDLISVNSQIEVLKDTVYSEGNTLTIIFREPNGKQGITFLAATEYSFYGMVNVKTLSQSDGPILVDATERPQIVHYVAPVNTNTIRYSTHFTFIGGGNVTFYAGAVTEPREELLLAQVCEDDASLTTPLEIKGRGRTLTLDQGKVIIDSSLSYQSQFEFVQFGQRGVLMSANYPYSTGKEEFDAIKLIGPHNETFFFQVEVFGSGLLPGDLLTIEIKGAGEAVEKNYTLAADDIVSGTGTQLSMRYVLGRKSEGVLVKYHVQRPTTTVKKGGGRKSTAIAFFILNLYGLLSIQLQ